MCSQLRCYSCLFFTLLSPLLMQILVSRDVRIKTISGFSLDNTLRWSSSLSRERQRPSALRQCRTPNCFFVGGPPIFLSIDRTENAVVWPPFKTQLNSFSLIRCLWQLFLLPCVSSSGVACGLEYTCVLLSPPSMCIHFLICGVSILVGAHCRMRSSFWHLPFWKCRPVYLRLS